MRQNSKDIAELRADVKQNSRDIRQNSTDIAELKAAIKQNSKDIRQNNGDIAVLKNDVHSIKLLLENDVKPRIDTIESCYVDTYSRYLVKNEEIDYLKTDMEILKKVTKEHSAKLKEI